MREMNISHKLHPLRMGKSAAGLQAIRYCLAANKKLALGTADVDALYVQVKLLYPEAKLTKCQGYLLIESE